MSEKQYFQQLDGYWVKDQEARTSAQNAQTIATSSQNIANTANQTANQAESTANSASSKANKVENDLNELKPKVKSYSLVYTEETESLQLTEGSVT